MKKQIVCVVSKSTNGQWNKNGELSLYPARDVFSTLAARYYKGIYSDHCNAILEIDDEETDTLQGHKTD